MISCGVEGKKQDRIYMPQASTCPEEAFLFYIVLCICNAAKGLCEQVLEVTFGQGMWGTLV